MINQTASIREGLVFAIVETTSGTFQKPTAAAMIPFIGTPTHTQSRTTQASEEIARSRSVLTRCIQNWKPGDWAMSTHMHSTTPGVEPSEAALMECGLGTKTIVGGTSVEYKPAIVKPSMTMLFHYGHTAFYAVGATVSSVAIAVDPQNSCFVTLDCSGQFMKLIKVKSAVLTAELVSGAILEVGTQAAKEYDVDGIVYLQTADGLTTDDNAGAGYQIISKDEGAGTITVNADPTPIASGSSVKPWAPAGWVMPASIPGKALDSQVDTVNEVMSTSSFTITDEVEYLTDEKTPSGYPEAYTCGARAVSLAAASYLRPASLKYLQQAEDGESYRFTIVPEASVSAGKRLTIDALNTKPNVIVVDDKGITKGVSITADIDGTVGEDELSITYS